MEDEIGELGSPTSTLVERVSANSADELVDHDGRPFGEQRVPHLMVGVPTELKKCPYPDSRADNARPMNTTALKAMASAWEPTLATLVALHHMLREPGGVGNDSYLTLWRLIDFGIRFPEYLALRRDNPLPSKSMPIALGATHKVLMGLYNSVGMLAIRDELRAQSRVLRWLDRGPPLAYEPEALYTFVDRQKQLIGMTEVCAGPPKLILAVFEALMRGPAGELPVAWLTASEQQSAIEYMRCAQKTMLVCLSFLVESRRFRVRAWRPSTRAVARVLETKMRMQKGMPMIAASQLDKMPNFVRDTFLRLIRSMVPELANAPTTRPQGALADVIRSSLDRWAPIEARHLAAFNALEAKATHALGYSHPRPVTAATLVTAFGATPTSVLRDHLADLDNPKT